jgi:hypothetical protein
VSVVRPYAIDKQATKLQFGKIRIFYHCVDHTANIAGATVRGGDYVGELETAVNEEVNRVCMELGV